MMEIGTLLWWGLVGLVAGGLASTLASGQAPRGLLGVIGSGIIGSVLGGWGWALLFGSGPASFLGSVVLGVLGALSILGLLRRINRPTHQT